MKNQIVLLLFTRNFFRHMLTDVNVLPWLILDYTFISNEIALKPRNVDIGHQQKKLHQNYASVCNSGRKKFSHYWKKKKHVENSTYISMVQSFCNNMKASDRRKLLMRSLLLLLKHEAILTSRNVNNDDVADDIMLVLKY